MMIPFHSDVSISPVFGVVLASVEGFLVILIIAAISSFFKWLKNKGGETTDNDWWPKENTPPQAPTTVPRRPSQTSQPPTARRDWPKQTTNWEEELKRALQKTSAPVPPPVPARPTPPLAPTQPTTPVMSVPKVFQQPKYYKAHCNNCNQHIEFPASTMGQVIACPNCHRPTVLRPFEETRVESVSHQAQLTTLTESQRRYETASKLPGTVDTEMEQTMLQPVQATSAEDFQKRSEEIQNVIDLLRRPQTARQAILASVILAPPKALEG